MDSIFVYINGEPTNGTWVDLNDVSDWDDIKEVLADIGIIPVDEDNGPLYGGDLLVATTEGAITKHFLSQYDVFDLEGYLDCVEHEADDEAKAAYLECFGEWSSSDFDDRYRGQFDSWTAMAEDYLDSTGELESIPERLRYYFDYEAYGRDIRLSGDMREHDGYFFYNN